MNEQAAQAVEEDRPDSVGPKTVTIIVNGQEHEFAKTDITYDEVVALAFPNPPTGPYIEISVTYRRGHGQKPEGTLLPGGEVKVKPGMIFNVTATDKS
jgi:hypothetical protein